MEKMESMEPKSQGLGLWMAVIFLAGQMAGVGVLALPSAMVGTGPTGFFLLIYFTYNAIFVGQRLGLCWMIIEEKFPELQSKEGCRDPYMVIAEKAIGPVGRHIVSVCVSFTLYGVCCVVLVLMGSFLQNIFESFGVDSTKCIFMIIISIFMAPLCWLGTPKDFWFVAVGALISTVIGCIMVMVKEAVDVADHQSCYYTFNSTTGDSLFDRHWPEPSSPLDFGKAFSSVMFAFAGASTFPTIQADMKNKSQFPKAAFYSMLILCMVYLPMSVVGWGLLGDQVGGSVIDSLCNGPAKVCIEILFLLHLISAFPIIINPPCQFFESLLNISPQFGLKRVIFRSFSVVILLLIGLSLPNFGAILNLIGATTITLLNFIFPPIFFLILSKSEHNNEGVQARPVSLMVRIYCWHMVIVCSIGGIIAFYASVTSISQALSGGESCWVTLV